MANLNTTLHLEQNNNSFFKNILLINNLVSKYLTYYLFILMLPETSALETLYVLNKPEYVKMALYGSALDGRNSPVQVSRSEE